MNQKKLFMDYRNFSWALDIRHLGVFGVADHRSRQKMEKSEYGPVEFNPKLVLSLWQRNITVETTDEKLTTPSAQEKQIAECRINELLYSNLTYQEKGCRKQWKVSFQEEYIANYSALPWKKCL